MAAPTVDPWSYSPSPVAAMMFLMLFTIATIWHAIIMVRCRVWYFSVLVTGGGLEIAGYLTRYLASKHNTNLTLFIVQTLCILVAPALFAASIYMVLGRLILLVGAEAYSPIRPTRLTKIFVLGDLVSFVVQIMGAGMLSSNFNLGKSVILVGLVAQLVCFGLFVSVAVIVSRRLARNPTPAAKLLDGRHPVNGSARVMCVVFLASALIFVRSVFRLVESTGNQNSPMQKSEVYLNIYDSTLMFGVLAILGFFHPSENMPDRKEVMRIQGEELL